MNDITIKAIEEKIDQLKEDIDDLETIQSKYSELSGSITRLTKYKKNQILALEQDLDEEDEKLR